LPPRSQQSAAAATAAAAAAAAAAPAQKDEDVKALDSVPSADAIPEHAQRLVVAALVQESTTAEAGRLTAARNPRGGSAAAAHIEYEKARRRMDSGNALHCGQQGHIVRDCPDRAQMKAPTLTA
jgi:hypothetical protein